MELFLLINFSLLAILGAVGLLFYKIPIYSVLSFIVTLVCVAGLYLLLFAKTLFLIQIVVYAGAIMVLGVFVMMFFNIKASNLFKKFSIKSLILALPVVVIFILFAQSFLNLDINFAPLPQNFGEIAPFGLYLFTHWGLNFEAISLLLTAALVAVVAILKGKNDV